MVGRYCTAQDVRTFTGLTEIDAQDSDLEEFLDAATKAMIEQIAVEVKYEVLTPGGSGNTYYTKHYPLADTDGDITVSASEIIVYGWDDIADSDTRVALTISTVSASDGKLTLSTSPSHSIVTANYHYYKADVDSTLLRQLTALYAGYLYAFTKWIWIPDTYQLGPVRVRSIKPVWEKIFKQYVRTLNLVQKRPFAIGKPFIKRSLVEMDATVSDSEEDDE